MLAVKIVAIVVLALGALAAPLPGICAKRDQDNYYDTSC